MENYKVLKALRIRADETQAQAAERLSVSTRTVSGWESPNSHRLLPRQMKRIYKAYKVTEPEAIALAESYARDIDVIKPTPEFLNPKHCYYDVVIGMDDKGNLVMLLEELEKLLRGKIEFKDAVISALRQIEVGCL